MDGIQRKGLLEYREKVGLNTGRRMNVIQGEGWVEYREGEGLIHYMNKDRIQEEYMEKV